MTANIGAFWQTFLTTHPDPKRAQSKFYEAFAIGDTQKSADEGVALILSGKKTATSALLWEYEVSGTPPPEVGSLSILLNGKGEPVCVVETSEVEVKPLNKVDAAFARDYGEWDGMLTRWRETAWAYYEAQCRDLGKTPTPDMPLVCERCQVIYSQRAVAPSQFIS